MDRMINWISDRFAHRPWWMNFLMVFCAFMAFIYMPWDFLVKPAAVDEEVWFGLLLRGGWAKATEPLHWAIYAAGAYGFWNMRSWMWPWAALYAAQVAFGMLIWPMFHFGGFGGFTLGLVSFVPFAAVAWALWKADAVFQSPRPGMRERYGDWALITGASAGIGAEFARVLAREGVNCVLSARRKDRLEELASELEDSYGGETRVVEADLASPGGADALARAVEDIEVSILINNAGAGYAGRFEKQDLERLAEMVQLNCTAPLVLTGRMLPSMISRHCGAVIIVGSVAGRQPLPFHAAYAATKSFDLLLGEALWAELRDQGVDVLVLQPGPVATEFEAVAGEARPDPSADQAVGPVVESALDALGRQPSVASSWMNWARANVNRLLPRSLLVFVTGELMEKQTPEEMR